MLIPIKCVTCGKVLADKYRYYEKRVREKKTSAGNDYNNVTYFTSTTKDKTGYYWSPLTKDAGQRVEAGSLYYLMTE